MNKKLLYLFIFVLSVFFGKETQAGTDVLSNVLTTCNTVLKEVGEVQNKYSGKIREILSLKISPADLLRSVGAGKMVDAAERLQERGEIMKEKAEKYKERMEFAKENYDELKSKYDELNQKANETFAEAKEMMDKGKALYEEAKGKYEEGKAIYEEAKVKYEEGKAIYEETKAKIEEGVEVGREVVGTAQELSGQKSQDKKLADAAKSEAMMREAEMMQAEAKREKMSTIDIKENQFTPVNKDSELSAVPMANNANAKALASKLAENTDLQVNANKEIPNISDIKEKELNISAEDIIKNVANIDKNNLISEKEIKTDVKMDAQLLNSVNKVDINSKAPDISDISLKDMKDIKKQDIRAKFGESKSLTEDKPQKADLKEQELLNAKALAEKAAKKMSKQSLNPNDAKSVSASAQLQKVNAKKANDIKAKISSSNNLKDASAKAVDIRVNAQTMNLQKTDIKKDKLTAKENINVR